MEQWGQQTLHLVLSKKQQQQTNKYISKIIKNIFDNVSEKCMKAVGHDIHQTTT